MTKGIDLLTLKIEEWAINKNIHDADPNKQMLKLGEEFGELCQSITKNTSLENISLEIGDIYVVLTILSMQLDLDIEECISAAYTKIADRKGKTINGVFVKEADLQ